MHTYIHTYIYVRTYQVKVNLPMGSGSFGFVLGSFLPAPGCKTYPCMYVCICMYMYVFIYVLCVFYVCMYLFIYVCCKYMYVCMHSYMYGVYFMYICIPQCLSARFGC